MFLWEWREFPSAPCRAGKKYLMTARVSMLLKSCASLTSFLGPFLPVRANELSSPRYYAIEWESEGNVCVCVWHSLCFLHSFATGCKSAAMRTSFSLQNSSRRPCSTSRNERLLTAHFFSKAAQWQCFRCYMSIPRPLSNWRFQTQPLLCITEGWQIPNITWSWTQCFLPLQLLFSGDRNCNIPIFSFLLCIRVTSAV